MLVGCWCRLPLRCYFLLKTADSYCVTSSKCCGEQFEEDTMTTVTVTRTAMVANVEEEADQEKRMQMAMDRVTQGGNRRRKRNSAIAGAKDDVEPLDEEDQELVIRQFKADIRNQFVLLRRVMLVLCVLWELLILWVGAQPVHMCNVASIGSFMIQRREFTCPPTASSLVQGIMAVAFLAHLLTLTFLLLGHKKLLQLGYMGLLVIPVFVIGYGLVGSSEPKDGLAEIQAAAANGGPAVGSAPHHSVDMNLVSAFLVVFSALALLFHYLAGNVYSCRDDLRDQLRLLAAKKYQYKSL